MAIKAVASKSSRTGTTKSKIHLDIYNNIVCQDMEPAAGFLKVCCDVQKDILIVC